MISIRILQSIGPAYAQQWITRFGFDAEKHPAYLTMALGAGSVTPLQMASAYSVFANGGYRVNPMLISRITDTKGHVLNEARVPVLDESMRTLDARNAFVMTSLLQEVTRSAPRPRRRPTLKRPDVYGKTGTTNDSLDAWFAGWQKNVVGVVWMGYDKPRKLGDRETGGGLSLPIWIDYMSTVLKGVPVQEPTPPEGVVNVGGEWFYEEYARGSGVSSVGLEEKAPTGAERGRAQHDPRPLPQQAALKPAPGRAQASKRSALPPSSLARGRQHGEELAAVAPVDPAPARRLEVKAARRRRQPELVQRRLGVDDDRAAAGKAQLEQAAGAAGVDVDHVVLQQAIDGRLDRRQRGAGAAARSRRRRGVRDRMVMVDKIAACSSVGRV